MAFTRTWIDTKLSRKERAKLVEYLLERWNNPTAEQILDALEELFPLKQLPSIRSVSDWKNKSWAFEVALVERSTEAEAAKRIIENDVDFCAANRSQLDEILFRRIRELKDGDEIDEKFHDLVLSSARLTAQDRANKESSGKLKYLERKIESLENQNAEFKRKEEERKKALEDLKQTANGKAITPEFIEEVQRTMGLI